jgi:hypothetical protein
MRSIKRLAIRFMRPPIELASSGTDDYPHLHTPGWGCVHFDPHQLQVEFTLQDVNPPHTPAPLQVSPTVQAFWSLQLAPAGLKWQVEVQQSPAVPLLAP